MKTPKIPPAAFSSTSRADLVFLDVQLPDGDGFELANEIQASSNAGIIFVTRRDTDAGRILGPEIAGDHYVTKPINLRDLLARAACCDRLALEGRSENDVCRSPRADRATCLTPG